MNKETTSVLYPGSDTDFINVYRVSNNYYGNPRYIVHYLSLGLSDYASTKQTRSAGFKIYRGSDFGGGFVFESYNPSATLKRYFEEVTQ